MTAYDNLLAAISHAGAMTWEQFKGAAEELQEEPAAYVRRNLARLGHIDHFPNERLSISAAAASIALIPSRDARSVAVMCGRRTSQSTSEFIKIAQDLGI